MHNFWSLLIGLIGTEGIVPNSIDTWRKTITIYHDFDGIWFVRIENWAVMDRSYIVTTEIIKQLFWYKIVFGNFMTYLCNE